MTSAKWSLLSKGKFKLSFDGSSKGYQNKSGVKWLMRNKQVELLKAFTLNIPLATSNEAEIEALLGLVWSLSPIFTLLALHFHFSLPFFI